MGGAPVIVWIREGVGYESAAAASMRRFEHRLGRPHDSNSSYRDYNTQESMYNAWNAWVSGRGPRPNHSRAIAPWESKHCMGLADDSDEWTSAKYNTLAAEYGWIRTAADDPTERHHYEYQWWRDQHRNDPAPAGREEDDMPVEDIYVEFRKPKGQPVKAGTVENLHINAKKDISVARGVAKHIAGNLVVQISGGVPYKGAVQVTPVVRTVVAGKTDTLGSLRAREIVFTGGETFGEVAVNCALQDNQRLSFRIGGSSHDFTVVSATFRGMKVT